ncbi:MAG: TraR/DksA C4-type zinc finger protein [Patescibacteria group bacterium]
MKLPKDILVEIKTHLEEELSKVHAQIAELSKQDPFADTDRLSDNAASDTEANEENNHERYQAMLTEVHVREDEIKAALQRIEKGTYGFCANCAKLIDTERLAANPTAILCMECEAKKKR